MGIRFSQNGLFLDPKTGQIMTNGISVGGGQWVSGRGANANPANSGTTPTGSPLPSTYTPNPVTAAQLSSLNSNRTIPQWMMDQYTQKIGSMGGNANGPLPFGLNQTGFAGMKPQQAPQITPVAPPVIPPAGTPAGKTGQYLPVIENIQGGVGGALDAIGGLFNSKMAAPSVSPQNILPAPNIMTAPLQTRTPSLLTSATRSAPITTTATRGR